MTLKGKNRYTIVLAVFFSGISVLLLVYFLLRINSLYKTNSFANYNISLQGYSPVAPDILSMLFAKLCLLVYIPAAAFYLYFHFLKTPAGEVIYFMLFLLGCTAELLRIFIPLEIVQNTYPELLVNIGRTLFWGRSLCFASLFTGVIAGTPDQRVNTEQYIFMLLIFFFVLASLVPIDTTKIPDTFSIEFERDFIINFFYALTAILTFLTYAIKAFQSENKSFIMLGVYILLIETGIILLSSSDILLLVIPSAILLFAGTILYLRLLHKLYV